MYMHGRVYQNTQISRWDDEYDDPESSSSKEIEQLTEMLTEALKNVSETFFSAFEIVRMELFNVCSSVGARVTFNIEAPKFPWEEIDAVFEEINHKIFDIGLRLCSSGKLTFLRIGDADTLWGIRKQTHL
ncbi:unnamed protein product [Echinostoma caproni]|uniref:Uncharacterized protein n=1 Tax=Echinostoma caproni TaxID=27848 RepID=A0A3P8GYJ6_9TREM|nr:unnamed protein product [Echinostoma caproni]